MGTDAPQSFHEITVRVRSVDADAVSNFIIEYLSEGLQVAGDDDPETKLTFYVPDGAPIDALLAKLHRYLNAINPEYKTGTVDRRLIMSGDWIESYRQSTPPILIGESLVIVPPWNTDEFPDRLRIVIEPKMAFGTGRHESTQGCLAVLENLTISDKRVLDIGCGSGILGIYAAKRGASEVIGYDIDPVAVDNSTENFVLNEVETACRAYKGTIDDVTEEGRFDIIVVNIIKSVIVPIVGALAARLETAGTLILSGLLTSDRAEIDTALAQHGLEIPEVRDDNGWLTYRIEKR